MREVQAIVVCPRVVRTEQETEIVFSFPAFHAEQEYVVTIHPLEEMAPTEYRLRTAEDGALRLRHYFTGEQEYLIRVALADGDPALPGEARIYALDADLYARRPFKGDLHMHSNRSDGQEPPAHVVAACRRIGLDFMALTDHKQYAPSLEAQQAFAGVRIDLRVFPGEEVHHQPYNPVHIVNFGGQWSVNALIDAQSPYLAEVEALEATITDPTLRGEQRRQYAQSLWTYQKIREAGGLAIFCHPYWMEGLRHNVPEAMIARHFADQPFGAYEVIGGYFRHEIDANALQVARYHEERARGRKIPIVGVSDAHGCERGELFGWYYTIVFAPALEFTALVTSITECYSVAVEALPGELPRVHGPFRLVKFAHFLLREVFSTHDALCQEEGLLMLSHLAGDPQAVQTLAEMQGRVAAEMERCWGVKG